MHKHIYTKPSATHCCRHFTAIAKVSLEREAAIAYYSDDTLGAYLQYVCQRICVGWCWCKMKEWLFLSGFVSMNFFVSFFSCIDLHDPDSLSCCCSLGNIVPWKRSEGTVIILLHTNSTLYALFRYLGFLVWSWWYCGVVPSMPWFILECLTDKLWYISSPAPHLTAYIRSTIAVNIFLQIL